MMIKTRIKRMLKRFFKKNVQFLKKHRQKKTLQKWGIGFATFAGRFVRLLKDVTWPYLKIVVRAVWRVVKAILRVPFLLVKTIVLWMWKVVKAIGWVVFVLPFKILFWVKDLGVFVFWGMWRVLEGVFVFFKELLRRPMREDKELPRYANDLPVYTEGSVGADGKKKSPKTSKKISRIAWVFGRFTIGIKELITWPLIAIRFFFLKMHSGIGFLLGNIKTLGLGVFSLPFVFFKKLLALIALTALLPFKMIIGIFGIIIAVLAFIGMIFSKGLRLISTKIAYRIFEFLRKPAFQFSLVTLTILYVVGILWWQYHVKTFPEPLQKPVVVTEAIKSFSSNVQTGVFIQNFPTFDFYKNSFIVDAVVWFKFPLGTESLDTIGRFSFKDGRILSQSKPIITQSGNMVTARYQVLADIKTYLDYRNFPFSGHRLHIVLENRSVSPRELTFEIEKNDFGISDQIAMPSWRVSKMYVNSGYIYALVDPDDKTMGVSYPAVVFAIDFANNSIRTIVALFLPMFLIFLLGLVTFVTAVFDKYKMQLSALSMPSLVLFRLVVEAQSPSRVRFTQADSIYFLLVALSLLTLLFNTYVLIRTKRIEKLTKKERERAEYPLTFMNNVLFLIVVVILMGGLVHIAIA